MREIITTSKALLNLMVVMASGTATAQIDLDTGFTRVGAIAVSLVLAEVAVTGQVESFQWSSDGQYLVYSVARLQTREFLKVPEGKLVNLGHIHSMSMYIEPTEIGIWSAALGSTRRLLTLPPGAEVNVIQFLPGSSTVAIQASWSGPTEANNLCALYDASTGVRRWGGPSSENLVFECSSVMPQAIVWTVDEQGGRSVSPVAERSGERPIGRPPGWDDGPTDLGWG